jgi:hypothetical protein
MSSNTKRDQGQIQEMKIRFVSKLGTIGRYSDNRKKYHVMIPKQFIDELDTLDLEGKQVKVTIEDEI